MYLKGLGDIFTDEAQATGDAGLTQASEGMPVGGWDWSAGSVSLPVPSTQPPTDGTDWTKLVSTALTTWSNFAIAKEQSKAAIATAPYRVYSPYATLTPGGAVYPGYASASPLSGSTLLIGAALVVAAFLFMKD